MRFPSFGDFLELVVVAVKKPRKLLGLYRVMQGFIQPYRIDLQRILGIRAMALI